MDNAALFRVRTEAAERIKVAMAAHKLPKDSVGGYRYNHAVTFVENIEGVLEDEYFEAAKDGMKGLLSATANELTGFKANVAITRADVKKASLAAAALVSSTTAAEITTNEDAQEEANRQNVFRLASIGVKEGMAREITARVGASITNPILRHPDGVRMKKVDEYLLHELVAAVMEGAERPSPIEIRKQITAIMAFTFDWRETGATNQERLAADIVKADAFGVTIQNDVKAVIILANIAAAAKFSSGGTEIREAQRKIKASYKYDHSHNDASIKEIMKRLATADEQRDRATIAAPTGFANLVTDKLKELVAGTEESDTIFSSDEESAMAATSDSESSAERPARGRGRASQRKGTRRTTRRKTRTSTSPSPTRSTRGPYVSPTRRSNSRAKNKLAPHEVNPTKCKWCKKWGGNGLAHGPPNNIPHSKCNYNEEWDGWRPTYVCRRMNIAYKDRDECEE
jgi:phosphotransferase system HPr-like phosphotransfer protein